MGEPLGAYEDFKWGSPLRVTVMMMEVTQWEDDWLEADVRQRRWVTPQQAIELITSPELCRFAQLAAAQMVDEELLSDKSRHKPA